MNRPRGKKFLCFKTIVLGLLTLLCAAAMPFDAYAGSTPYFTRTVGITGMFITMDAYVPLTVMEQFGGMDLRDPSDISFSADGYLYIADTGNSRVIKASPDGEWAEIIGEDYLGQPRGVFVNDKKEVYVADSAKRSVFLFGPDGGLIKEYTRPESVLFGKAAEYTPTKVCADRAGNVYIISAGNTNGIIQLSREGDFFGYVGANKTPLGINAIIQRLLSTTQQQSQMKLNVPVTPNNLAIDQQGLIYTVTQGGASDGVKKFNIAGVNMLDEVYADELVTAVCVNSIGNIITVSGDGYICEYTSDGELLFLYGGRDDGYNRDGLFSAASAIATDAEDHVYVLDTEGRSITVLEQTEYAATIHYALDLHRQGRYLESRAPWAQTLRHDAMFLRAQKGMGDAYYKLEMYNEAMHSYKLSYNETGYSNAFWEVRNEWMIQYLPYVFLGLFIFWLLAKGVRFADKKTQFLAPVRNARQRFSDIPLVQQLGFMTYMPKNPADAFYGIKFEKKVSIASATILYVSVFVVFVLNKYLSGYLFKQVMDGYYELEMDFALVFGMIALTVIGNNLICAISDGEGRLRDVYCAAAYCLTPYLLIKPWVVIVSHVLTYNESFIISFANFFIYASCGVLLFVMVREIQGYTYRKTLRVVLLTVFAVAMLVVTGVIVFTLIGQVADFVMSVFREVRFRAV